MDFPTYEQRSHVDIFPGMLFYFVRNPPARDKPIFTDPDPAFDKDGAWLVLCKEYVEKTSYSHWKYLLFGPGPIVKWHIGQLGWIRRVVDPVWEERFKSAGAVAGW